MFAQFTQAGHSLPFTRGQDRGGWKVPSVSVIHFHKLPPLISEFIELRWHFAETHLLLFQLGYLRHILKSRFTLDLSFRSLSCECRRLFFFLSICWLYYFGRNKASNFHTHPCVERRNKLPGTTSWKTTKYHNIQNKIEWLFEKRLTQPGHRRDFIWRQLKRKGHYLFLHLMHSLRHWTINWHLAGRPQNYPCAISMELFCAKFTSLCVYIYVRPTYNM